MTSIKEALVEFNPWWKGSFSENSKEREIYKEIKKFFDKPQIIAISGLRRVGKTTLMKKFIGESLKKLESKNIVYFSFDEFKNSSLREILLEWQAVMQVDISKENCLVLFDEIQKLEDWENQLKTIYDLNKGKIKIIISGSESLFLRKKSRESLAGRIFDFKMNPLSFKEFLVFKDIKISNKNLYEKELRSLFEEYKFIQGFPELIGEKNEEIITKYIQEGIIERIIFKDIPSIYKVEEPDKMKFLLNIIQEEPGQILELNKLSSEIGLSRQTVSNYLSYLEDSFLIRKLYNYSRNKRKSEKKLKKYYPVIISPKLLFKNERLIESKVFENFLVNLIEAEFFWRDSSHNEVDVIFIEQEKIVPIEIKYGRIDPSGLIRFMQQEGISEGIILSENIENLIEIDNKKIEVISAWKYFCN
jgi:uncharacterized protein